MISLRSLLLAIVLLAAVCGTQAGNVEFIKKMLDGPLEDIQWASKQVIFVLTDKGTVYRSDNRGRSWTAQNPKFVSDHCTNTKIDSMYVSEADSNMIFFVGKRHCNFVTNDMGKSYAASQLDVRDIRWHPTQALWVLASSMSHGCSDEVNEGACYKQLHYSKDAGKTWTKALEYVVQFDWSPSIGSPDQHNRRSSDDIIYATAYAPEYRRGDQRFGVWDKNIDFISSSDFFNSFTQVVQHGNRFLFGEHSYLFVAAVNPREENQVTLKISRDNTTRLDFTNAQIPVDLTQHSYTILDTSEGTVFLHVNHKPFHEASNTGNIYVSDWSGTRYVKSLSSNHRSADGKCDFEKVEGLEGIYLANFIDEEIVEDQESSRVSYYDEEEEEEAQDSEYARHQRNRMSGERRTRVAQRTKTVITFDKGGEWSYLAAPTTDSQGKPVACTGSCHLHLHGITDMWGPFYTAASAVGMVMATGNVGDHLTTETEEINTYLSRDGGLSWFEVSKGSHIYEFGDHGGLIVMSPDSHLSDHILYSWDEGLTWTTLKISEERFQIENIIIEPEANSQQFVVYGYQGNQGVIVYIDFEELHEKVCTGLANPGAPDSDYENWSPSDGRYGEACLLGHHVNFVRRKRDRQCFNPVAFERPVFMENCPCSALDYQCDFGYEHKRGISSGECEAIHEMNPTLEQASHQILIQEQCQHQSTYTITKGYRKVPGDTCVGGDKWEPIVMPCPSAFLSSSGFSKTLLFIVFLIVASFAFVTFASRFEFLEECLQSLRGRFGAVKYRLVGSHKPESMTDDDAFYLSEDEFGPSAHLIDGDDGAPRSRKGDSKKDSSDFNPRNEV